VIDIPNAFIQTRVDDPKDRVIIRMRGVVVDWLVKTAPEVYGPFVTKDKKGNKVLLVECWNAIYGTMIAGLLYYRKFSESLAEQGYVQMHTTHVYGTR
jgi:transposase-like protein